MASPFSATQPGAAGTSAADIWGGQAPTAGGAAQGYPTTGDLGGAPQGSGYTPGSAAGQNYFGAAGAPSTGGGFAPGSTRPMADPSVSGASGYGTQTATNLTAPPANTGKY